jgi:NADH-quinone oxidoreductase subunit J
MMLLAALNWHSIAFLFFALVACGFAIAVVMTANIVRMAFYLTLCLGATSGLFFLAGAEFVGAMQLMIYVGGTLVLLIFGVMLTAQARFISMNTGSGELVLAAILGGSLLLLLLRGGLSVESWTQPRAGLDTLPLAVGKTSTPIGLALAGVRVDQLDEPDEQIRRGMSGYLFPFVIISMHLLVVLIGASYMARTKRLAAGGVVEQLAAAPRRPHHRQRSLAVLGGIVSGIAVNLAIGLLGLAYWKLPPVRDWVHQRMLQFFGTTDLFPGVAASWVIPVIGGLFLANVLMLLVIDSWQRWGVVGLVVVTMLQAIALGNSGLDPRVAVVFFVVAIAPVALLILLLCTGKRPTMWDQMD